MRSTVRSLAVMLVILVVAPTAMTQEPPPPLDRADRVAIVEQISAALLETYVFPEDAEAMVKRLDQQLKSGAYDSLDKVPAFCQQLTKDLHGIRRDLHLHVDPAPQRPAEPSEEQLAERRKQRLERMRRANYSFRKLEMMGGNVGYLRFDGFVDAEHAGATAVAAMNFLANADAIIFDVRYNGGGAPSMIQLLLSYLLAEPTHINSFYVRKSDEMHQFWTQAHVAGPRMPEVPVFVLTSGRTFSAAEEFTYNLKNLERATIVGETTGGGAHPVENFAVQGYPMAVSLPFGRAINPITETNWEGTGIEPHIAVAAEQALDVAHQKALELIAQTTNDPRRREALELNSALLAVRIDPVELDEATLRSYSGSYGPRKIRVESGRLLYQREGRPEMEMVALGDDRFSITGVDGFFLSFERDDSVAVVAVLGHYPGGRTDRNERD